MPEPPRYEASPRYPIVAGEVRRGWPASAATLGSTPVVLAVDGPSIAPWQKTMAHLGTALAARGPVRFVDVREHMVEWDKVLARTDAPVLSGDPHFTRLASVELAELFDDLPAVAAPTAGTVVVFGPGAALARHDVLWYADLPKRYAEQAVVAGGGRNLGQPDGAGRATTRQLFYVDWPILDRHRDAVADRIDLWLDLQHPDEPRALEGHALRACLRELVGGPFRTRPTFNTTSWGGHWAQRELGINPSATNTALGYELIAPESGVLLGSSLDRQVEVPFQLVVACRPNEVLGAEVYERFGTSFPIRFDYLDTVDGGNLSVHCHPQAGYMHEVFGWPYPQHETYYVMVGGTDRCVYLGLHGGVDVDTFNRLAKDAAEHGIPFDIDQFVQTHPADPHQLFLIPAGTPHGSGNGNVVLEISATPYLYSLRFYDWLRRDRHGAQRPVHVDHAFANLDTRRTGDAVPAQLVQQPRTLRSGRDWIEELLGTAPEMFYEVRRITISGSTPAVDDTEGRFHILNVVDGAGVVIHTDRAAHPLVYAETIVVPAIVGPYRLERLGTGPVRVVKSLVRSGFAS